MLECCLLLSCCMRSPFQYSVKSLMVEMLYRTLNLRSEPMIWSARKWEHLFLPKTSLPIRVIALARWDRYVNRPRRTRIRLLRTGSPCQTCQYMSCVIPVAANHSNMTHLTLWGYIYIYIYSNESKINCEHDSLASALPTEKSYRPRSQPRGSRREEIHTRSPWNPHAGKQKQQATAYLQRSANLENLAVAMRIESQNQEREYCSHTSVNPSGCVSLKRQGLWRSMARPHFHRMQRLFISFLITPLRRLRCTIHKVAESMVIAAIPPWQETKVIESEVRSQNTFWNNKSETPRVESPNFMTVSPLVFMSSWTHLWIYGSYTNLYNKSYESYIYI